MNESEFNTLVDQTLERIEQSIEDCGVDIDYEIVGGILTLEFEDGSKIILNRQTPLKQLWMAARAGGFHFNYEPGKKVWCEDSNGEELQVMLMRYCSEQAGEEVILETV